MKKRTKNIGIIGGAGPFASSLLYDLLIKECYKLGCASETELPQIIIINYPFNIKMCKQQDSDGKPIIFSVLNNLMEQLITNGAELLALACNTFHLFLDDTLVQSDAFIHIAQTTFAEAVQRSMKRVLLLGTPITMQSDLYAHNAIEVVVPRGNDKKLIEQIVDRVLAGSVVQRDAATLNAIIAQTYKERPFDGVILGCTELPVLHNAFPLATNIGDNEFAILDTVQLLARRLARESLQTAGLKSIYSSASAGGGIGAPPSVSFSIKECSFLLRDG